jgi:hypothetical protein
MKTTLLVSLAALSSSLLAGCLGCAGFSGGGDKVYQRGNDALIVCENGGYSATVNGASLEGRVESGSLVDGATGAKASDLTQTTIVTAFGGEWTAVSLDTVALDHANVMCTDLESRAWWNTSEAELPKDTLFGKAPDAFASVDACITAQAAGTYPTNLPCQDQMVLCTDGTMQLVEGDTVIQGTYLLSGGGLEVLPNGLSAANGFYTTDGKFGTTSIHDPSKNVEWSTTGVIADAYSPHCAN